MWSAGRGYGEQEPELVDLTQLSDAEDDVLVAEQRDGAIPPPPPYVLVPQRGGGRGEHPPRAKPTKAWVFTIFLIDQEDHDRSECAIDLNLWIIHLNQLSAQYCVAGREVCPATGRHHLQGFVYFKSLKTFETASAAIYRPNGVGFDKCFVQAKSPFSTFAETIDYCKKDDDIVVEYGVPPVDVKEAQQRGGEAIASKWSNTRACAEIGDFEKVCDQHFVQYYNTLQTIYRDKAPMPADLPEVCGFWIVGASGAGKTTYAHQRWPNSYRKSASKWWCGYQDQASVVLDDFDTNHACLGHHLKLWGDKFSFIAEIKGRSAPIRPKAFVITSQYTVEEIWPADHHTQDAIKRRFKVIYFYDRAPHDQPPPIQAVAGHFVGH